MFLKNAEFFIDGKSIGQATDIKFSVNPVECVELAPINYSTDFTASRISEGDLNLFKNPSNEELTFVGIGPTDEELQEFRDLFYDFVDRTSGIPITVTKQPIEFIECTITAEPNKPELSSWWTKYED